MLLRARAGAAGGLGFRKGLACRGSGGLGRLIRHKGCLWIPCSVYCPHSLQTSHPSSSFAPTQNGQLIPINRSTPPSPVDVYRCAGCTREECQGPTGCMEFQWRHQSNGYLREILTSRVYAVARETPLEKVPNLSRQLGCTLYLKREDLQPVHSFKIRGAYNRMARLTPEELKRGVICSSAGNHAQGVAMSAAKLVRERRGGR